MPLNQEMEMVFIILRDEAKDIAKDSLVRTVQAHTDCMQSKSVCKTCTKLTCINEGI